MIKKLAIGAAAVVAVLLVTSIVMLNLLQPPHQAVTSQSQLTLSGMVFVVPGESRFTGHLSINDGRIGTVSEQVVQSDFECPGCFVLPGLIDSHVHFPPTLGVGQQEQFALLLLAHGVTAVRETGSTDLSTFALRDRILDGALVGPRIMACGGIIDGPSPAFPTNTVVSTPEDSAAAVRDLASQGADCIKVYNMLTEDAYRAIREEAEALGLPVLGHVPHRVGMSGIQSLDVQHVTGVVPYDPEVIGRDDYCYADVAALPDDRIDEVVALALANNLSFTPTLINQVRRRTSEDPIRFPPGPVAVELPRYWPAAWRAIFGAPFGCHNEADHAAHLTRQRELVRQLHEAGVPIRAGTDTMMPWVVPGRALHDELRELVLAGLTPEEALVAATRTAGDFFPGSNLGRLSIGAPADLVIFREDPTVSLDALDSIVAVIANGRLYTAEEFAESRAAQAEHFRGGLYDFVMSGVINAMMGSFAPEGEPDE